jgi:hypothetical protein
LKRGRWRIYTQGNPVKHLGYLGLKIDMVMKNVDGQESGDGQVTFDIGWERTTVMMSHLVMKRTTIVHRDREAI